MKIYEDNSLTMEAQVKSYKITGIGSLNVDDDTVEAEAKEFVRMLKTIRPLTINIFDPHHPARQSIQLGEHPPPPHRKVLTTYKDFHREAMAREKVVRVLPI